MRALIITPTMERTLTEFGEGKVWSTLTVLLDNVLGRAWEAVDLRVDFAHGCSMWMDEEGKYKDLAQNPLATSLLTRSYGLHDYVAGTAIITGPADEDGSTLGLTDDHIRGLMNFYDPVRAYRDQSGLLFR